MPTNRRDDYSLLAAVVRHVTLQALGEALRLGLWELSSGIAELVAPHYMELRSQGSFGHCAPVVEEALRDAYAGAHGYCPILLVIVFMFLGGCSSLCLTVPPLGITPAL